MEAQAPNDTGGNPGGGAADAPLLLLDTGEVPDDFLQEFPEDAAFYRATRDVIPGFVQGCLVASRAGVRVAVLPYFVTRFALNTMLEEGWLKWMLGGVSLRIACVGHPTNAFGRIEGEVSAPVLAAAYAVLSRKAPIVAFKGFGSDLPAPGFARAAGLPVAVLHLEGDFWGTVHNHKQRNDLTRKLKAAAPLRFEEHDGLPSAYLDEVYRYYLDTRSRSAVRFERLAPEYFTATAPRSIYLLAFLGERLVGFAQLLGKGQRAVAKYIGMDYTVNRAHELYFAFYLHSLELCARRGYTEIEYGETNYGFKQAIGCTLLDTWLYYRHRNALAQALLARLAFLLEPTAEELRR